MTTAENRVRIRDISDILEIEKVPFEQRDCNKTVYELLREGADLDPDRAAFLTLPTGDPDEEPLTTTYGEFLTQVHQAANLFNRMGVTRGDVVAILAPTLPQNYTAMLAAASVGIVCQINWMLNAEHIREILKSVNAKVLVTLAPAPDYEIWEKVEGLRKDVPSLAHVLQIALHGQTPDPEMDFDALIARENGAGLDFSNQPTPNDIALYAHTGGTTGVPKVAQLRHRAVAYKAWCYTLVLETAADHVVFAGSPLFHIGGIIFHTINTLAHGATTLVLGPRGFRNKAIVQSYWKLVERYGVTDLFGVPTTLSALANVPVDADISSLRPYAMTGSAGLPVAVSRYFAEKVGVRLLCNYGMTENTATIALPPRDGDPKFGSAGFRFPYTQIRIVRFGDDGKTSDCGTDEIGNIIIKGPGVMPGYLDESRNVDCFVDDGWFVTGDLGRFDSDQYLWVTGRAKDLIIRSGNNIDPLVIEEALLKHEDVALAAAIGKPDAYAGELPMAVVQLKRPGSTTSDALREFAAGHIAERPALPSEIIIVDSVPLTAVGKISKPTLRKMVAERGFREVLAPLKDVPCTYEVAMQDHPTSGTICTITISAESLETRDKAIEIAHRVMGEFTTPFEIQVSG